ncbi:cytochrome P450 3A30-like [Aplochiton taeniatus]
MFFSATTWTLVLIVATLLYLYGTWPYGLFKKHGILGPTPFPFVGTLIHAFRTKNLDAKCYAMYKRVWGLFDGRQPLLMVADPEMIKAILVKECYSVFTNRRETDERMMGPLKDAVTMVKDEKWKRIRSAISPIFTSGRMRQVFPLIDRYAVRLADSLKTRNLDEPVKIKELVAPYSLDIATSTSFSVDTDSINHPDDPIIGHMKKMMGFRLPLFLILMIFPAISHIMRLLKIGIFPKASEDFFTNIIKNFKNQHSDTEHVGQLDFLQMMMMQKFISESPSMTESEILSQSFIFILAGYETTSVTLTFLLYNLATHPEAMRTLQEEIDRSLPREGPVTYESITELEYLDHVIMESMRIFPTAPRLERTCKTPVEVDGIPIPKGMLVGIPVFSLHHDPQYWIEPQRFRPERFSKDSGEEVNPYVFMPFGVGPRNCVGMRFALLVMKMVIVRLLQKYDFESCKDTVIPLELNLMMQPSKPVALKIVPRVEQ